LSQALAAKVIQKEELASEQAEQVLVEIRALAMLRHKHVVRVLACHEDDQRLVLVMERARYDLYEALTRAGLFSEARTRRVMQQLLSALEYLHRNGVIHRDIKPENLLLFSGGGWDDSQMVLKVADFGTARILDDGAHAGQHEGLIAALRAMVTSTSYVGTSYYMAPEICWRRAYGPAVDVWSAGVVMHVLLSGEAPWGVGRTPHPVTGAAAQPPYSSMAWQGVSSEARSLLSGLLAVDPAQRLSAAAALEAPWFGVTLPEATPLPCFNPAPPPARSVAAARADGSPNCVSAYLAEGEAAEVVPAERSVADRRCFTPLACCAPRKTGSAKRMRVERTSGEQPLWHREKRSSQSSDV